MILTTRDLRDLQQEAGRLIRPDYDLGMLRVRYRVEANRLHPGDPEDVQNGHLGNLLAYLLAYCEREGLDAADALAARLAAERQESEAPDAKPLPRPNLGGHFYPGCEDGGDDQAFYTSDCEYGCGCWMGSSRSGGPEGVDPFGACPNQPQQGEQEPQGPLLWDGRPADDPERADAEEPVSTHTAGAFPRCSSCGVLTHYASCSGGALIYHCRNGHQTIVPHGTPPGRLPAAPLALHSLPVFTPEEIAAGALERLGPDAPPYVAIRRETVLSDADERDHRTVWERTQSAAVPGVWVAPAAGADLTPTAGMELEREIADAVEVERREGLG